MDNVDVGLFERDWNNAIYFFFLNADEQIYLRYGGRDAPAADTYLNLMSLELAGKQALELHSKYQKGELAKTQRPASKFPREIPLLVQRTFANNQCVECHLIGDYINMHREEEGTLDKIKHLYRSPDIKNIGIMLDVPKGLVVKEALSEVGNAGMKAGDRITALNGVPVYTFGDLQHEYDKVDRRAKTVRITVDRAGQTSELTVQLPPRWWWTDLRFRQSSVDARLYFEDRALTKEEKAQHGLKADGFASEVKYVSEIARTLKSHELKVGDIVYGVEGVESDEFAHTAEVYIKLHKLPGDTITLNVLRDGKKFETPLRSFRMSFRK